MTIAAEAPREIIAFPKRYRVRFARCAECGGIFAKKSPSARFCSDACRRTAAYGVHTCERCGAEFVPSDNSVGRFCSSACSDLSRGAAR